MELENNTAKQAYIHMMADTLKKKIEVLHHLMDLTQQQEAMIASDTFSDEEFLQLISLKDEQLQILSKLDSGFEQIFESIRDELSYGKEKYMAEITDLKDKITIITDLSVQLQVLEKRNKASLEALLSIKRRNIRKARISNQTAVNYYKTMAKQHEAQSYFYDKKK